MATNVNADVAGRRPDGTGAVTHRVVVSNEVVAHGAVLVTVDADELIDAVSRVAGLCKRVRFPVVDPTRNL